MFFSNYVETMGSQAPVIATLKQKACDEINQNSKELRDLSLQIWNNPELYYEEKFAHQLLTDFLDKKGFQVGRCT